MQRKPNAATIPKTDHPFVLAQRGEPSPSFTLDADQPSLCLVDVFHGRLTSKGICETREVPQYNDRSQSARSFGDETGELQAQVAKSLQIRYGRTRLSCRWDSCSGRCRWRTAGEAPFPRLADHGTGAAGLSSAAFIALIDELLGTFTPTTSQSWSACTPRNWSVLSEPNAPPFGNRNATGVEHGSEECAELLVQKFALMPGER